MVQQLARQCALAIDTALLYRDAQDAVRVREIDSDADRLDALISDLLDMSQLVSSGGGARFVVSLPTASAGRTRRRFQQSE